MREDRRFSEKPHFTIDPVDFGDSNNFPSGVTYQRNANFTSRALLALDNTTTVAPSIDPFFFKVNG